MLRRAALVVYLVLGACSMTCPLNALAQHAEKAYRIGLLGQGMNEPWVVELLSKGLGALGRADEAPAKFEERWAEDQWQSLPKLAGELVALRVDPCLRG